MQDIYVLIVGSFIDPYSLIAYILIGLLVRKIWVALLVSGIWRVLLFILFRDNPTPESYKILLLNLLVTSIITALIVGIKNSKK